MILTRFVVLSSIMLMTLSGCDQFTRQMDSDDTGIKEVGDSAQRVTINTFPILLTNVDQLRLRKYPDIKSEMLTTFDENTPVYFTGEQTDYEESIGSRKGPWKNVRTIDGEIQGWVFGAEHFVSEWLPQEELDSLHESGKDIRIINNLSRSEMDQLTGANFNQSTRGTRFSGYYEYNKGANPQIINGRMVLRAREFDTENKEVVYNECLVTFEKGMPVTELNCRVIKLPE